MNEEICDGKIHVYDLDEDFAYISIAMREGETFSGEAYGYVFLKKYARYLLDNCTKDFLIDVLSHVCSDRISLVQKTFEDHYKVIIKNPDPPLNEFGKIIFKFKREQNDNL